ncbi:unnamed protein product [Vitrella brassicaformis CCMP3155]|uniref:Uncharacterized protein n=1 Tax=Vitrella brassicaformis (strain CCMP3155) TaxID=1169540 RepID=A0A0G4F178_VITBC|nr:unnamed protein product [Vitrella brassicaformis CCMP3155]|eukprot:CEM05644.1 unnamed protein product [Vitrella brassicaformis CCMP3155]
MPADIAGLYRAEAATQKGWLHSINGALQSLYATLKCPLPCCQTHGSAPSAPQFPAARQGASAPRPPIYRPGPPSRPPAAATLAASPPCRASVPPAATCSSPGTTATGPGSPVSDTAQPLPPLPTMGSCTAPSATAASGPIMRPIDDVQFTGRYFFSSRDFSITNVQFTGRYFFSSRSVQLRGVIDGRDCIVRFLVPDELRRHRGEKPLRGHELLMWTRLIEDESQLLHRLGSQLRGPALLARGFVSPDKPFPLTVLPPKDNASSCRDEEEAAGATSTLRELKLSGPFFAKRSKKVMELPKTSPKTKPAKTTATKTTKSIEAKVDTQDHVDNMKDPDAAEDENPFWIVTAEGIINLPIKAPKKFPNALAR